MDNIGQHTFIDFVAKNFFIYEAFTVLPHPLSSYLIWIYWVSLIYTLPLITSSIINYQSKYVGGHFLLMIPLTLRSEGVKLLCV